MTGLNHPHAPSRRNHIFYCWDCQLIEGQSFSSMSFSNGMSCCLLELVSHPIDSSKRRFGLCVQSISHLIAPAIITLFFLNFSVTES
jgi:hypothetical protein